MKKRFYSFTEISNYAFANVQNGGKIIIPASVRRIGQEAFNNAYFETIEFAPGCELTSIGYMAFSFVHIQSIVLPTTLTSIDKEAFLNCSSLQSITIGGQAAADILLNGGIPETVTTLKLKDGITASIDGFETDRLGTFIVCIPGVAFVMPMWGMQSYLPRAYLSLLQL